MHKLLFIVKQCYWCWNKPYMLKAWSLCSFEWGALQGFTSILKVCGLTGGFKALVYWLKSMHAGKAVDIYSIELNILNTAVNTFISQAIINVL